MEPAAWRAWREGAHGDEDHIGAAKGRLQSHPRLLGGHLGAREVPMVSWAFR